MDEDHEQLGMFEMGETTFLGGLPRIDSEDNGSDDGQVFAYGDIHFNNDQSIIFPGQYTPEMNQIIETCLSNIRSGGNVLIEYPSDEKRRLATLSALLRHIQYLTLEGENQIAQVPGGSETLSIPLSDQKVYYAASSFQEMEQVVLELKKFKNTGHLQNITVAVLAHPSQLCRSCDDIYLCSLKSFTSTEFRFIEENGAVYSISEMKEKGHSLKRCSFRCNREISQQANLIFCTQEFLISPDLRFKFNVNLEKAVVIFDDGGNIENTCCAEASAAITTVRLAVAGDSFKIIADIFNHVNQRKQSGELLEIAMKSDRLSRNLTSFATEIDDQARRLGKTQPSTETIFQILKKNELSPDPVASYIKDVRLFLLHLENDNDICNAIKDQGTDLIILVKSVQKLLTSLNFAYKSLSKKDFSFEISKYVPQGAQAANTFKIRYANFSAVVGSIMDGGVLSFIISSGCLPSTSILRQELSPAAVFYEVEDAIIPEQTHTNCLFAYCSQGPNKVTFDYRHANKGNETVQNEAGEAILKIIQRAPNGVVVFLPSVKDLKDLVDYWKDADRQSTDKSIWDQMKEIKTIFCELTFGKRAEDVKVQLETFRKRCTSPLGNRTGALLLALHREKVSEIMDFQPGQVQCFVALGISFHSTYALNISAKEAYFLSQPNLTESERKKRNSLWYNAEAMYNLNRKIAHCISKEQDRLVVLVLDTRMRDKATGTMGELLSPKWIQKEWKGYSDFEELIEELADVFK